MSGLAGWVDFRRDVGREGAVVERMAATMAHRGPDGEGVWSGGHAALACRRLALVDLEHGHQPVVVADAAGPVAVLVLDGSIHNHDELRRELTSRGCAFRTRSDSEVALHAYLQWGREFASRLDGLFAIAVWNVRSEELVLVRDRLGVKPLCYQRTAGGVLLASEPKGVLAHPEVRPVVDEDGLRELFAHGKKPGTTVFRDMAEVRPGHTLRVTRSGVTESSYWTLGVHPHVDDLTATTAAVRSLLGDAVAGAGGADVEVAAMLSGGIDSSALTALAAPRARGRLRTFSVDFENYTDTFEPHPTMRATPDAPYAAMVAEHVGTDHCAVVLDTSTLSDPSAYGGALRSQDTPSPLGDMDASLYLFFGALRERGIRVVLSGETADELFNGYYWSYAPDHSRSDTFPWVSFERGHDAAAGGLGCSLIDLGLRRQLDFMGYADQHHRDAVAEVERVAGEPSDERRAREIVHLALTRWAPTHLDRADRLSMAHGVQLRPPFCDHRLVEYVANVPAAMKRVDGQEKSLLRSAVADLLPAAVLARPKSAYPTTQELTYGEAVRERFLALVEDRNAVVGPLLDHDATEGLRRSGSSPSGAFAWVERASMEMVLQMETWLREYAVELRV